MRTGLPLPPACAGMRRTSSDMPLIERPPPGASICARQPDTLTRGSAWLICAQYACNGAQLRS
jgi:hypothetical protein